MTLHENVMAALVYTVPALGKLKDGVPEFGSEKSKLIVDAQAKLLIDKSDFITTRVFPGSLNQKLIVRFERIILRGSARNKLWNIYVEFNTNSTRYPRLRFHTLKPEFAHLKDDNPKKWRSNNFISAIHPHISSSLPCWGGYESAVMGLLATFNYAGAMMVIDKFLNTWNRNSAYFDINYIRRHAAKPNVINKEQPHKLLTWGELAYLKRIVYDPISDRNRYGITFWKVIDFAVKTKTKKGIDWKMVGSWSYVCSHISHNAKVFFKVYKEIKVCNELMMDAGMDSFTFHGELVNSKERDILVWLNKKLTAFKTNFMSSVISDIPLYIIKEWRLFCKAEDEFSNRNSINLNTTEEVNIRERWLGADERWKHVRTKYLENKIEITKRTYMKDAFEYAKMIKGNKYGFSEQTRRLETENNILNTFNPEFYKHHINQVKLACCVKAWKKAQVKERRLRSEIATLRREPEQAELFHETISK